MTYVTYTPPKYNTHLKSNPKVRHIGSAPQTGARSQKDIVAEVLVVVLLLHLKTQLLAPPPR